MDMGGCGITDGRLGVSRGLREKACNSAIAGLNHSLLPGSLPDLESKRTRFGEEDKEFSLGHI